MTAEEIVETRDAYFEMRADGRPVEIAAAVSGIDVTVAHRWEQQEAQRKERIAKAANRTAERLMRAAKAADAAAIRAIRDQLDPERLFATALALAVKAIGGAADCECGHLDLFHNLSAKGERTGCSWHEGPANTPCGCKRFTEAAQPPSTSRYERVGTDGPGSERTAADVERRVAEFARLRAAGYSAVAASRQMKISARTGVRYEERLKARADAEPELARGAA